MPSSDGHAHKHQPDPLRQGFFSSLLSVTGAYGIDPPLGLKWSMTYPEVKETLDAKKKEEGSPKLKGLKDKFYSEIVNDKVYRGLKAALLRGIGLLGEEGDGYAFFDSSGLLCAVEYDFCCGNMWNFHSSLLEALRQKYGPPSKDETSGLQSGEIGVGHPLKTVWQDSTSRSALEVRIQQSISELNSSRYLRVIVFYRSGLFDTGVTPTDKL